MSTNEQNSSLDPILEADTKSLISLSQDTSIALWNDQKKQDFLAIFHNRIKVGSFIIAQTANEIMKLSEKRKFISNKHVNLLAKEITNSMFAENKYRDHYFGRGQQVGGRESGELIKIATQRAREILENLPSLRNAVLIIDPETAKLIDKVEEIKAKASALTEDLDKVSEPILMSELDQDLSIGEFSRMVKERDTERKKLIAEIAELTHEGNSVDEKVSKRLYSGLPGLSDAIINLVREHYEKVTALEQFERRVTEQVKFGDSTDAMSLLEHFEQDELKVSEEIKKKFDDALNTLKLSAESIKAAKKSTDEETEKKTTTKSAKKTAKKASKK